MNGDAALPMEEASSTEVPVGGINQHVMDAPRLGPSTVQLEMSIGVQCPHASGQRQLDVITNACHGTGARFALALAVSSLPSTDCLET